MCIFLCFAAEIHGSFPFIEIVLIWSAQEGQGEIAQEGQGEIAQEGQGEISENNFFVFCHSYMYVLLSILIFLLCKTRHQWLV
jgi:hypothetical protein